jgi:hypothetical protein
MSRKFVALGLATFLGFSVGIDLLACGDKFLVLGRGTRFQRGARAHVPAEILVYANPASALPKAFSNLPVESILHKAGHRSTSVASINELDRALRQSKFDVVLADIADSDAIKARLSQGIDGPLLVPVIYNPTGEELKEAKKHYACILRSPTRGDSFLDVIDDAVVMRLKAQSKSNEKPAK